MKRRTPKTWLDALVVQSAETYEKKLRRPCPLSEALRALREASHQQFVRLAPELKTTPDRFELFANPEYPIRPDDDIKSLYEAQLEFAYIEPFLCPKEDAVAIRMTDSLIETFADATTQQESDVLDIIMSKAWYFDFLGSNVSFDFNGEPHVVRAVLINGRYGFGHEVATWRNPPQPAVWLFFDNGKSEKIGEDYRYWYWRKDYAEIPDFPVELQRLLEDLVALTVLYFSTKPTEGVGKVPQASIKKLSKMRAINQRRALDDASLFHLIEVRAPEDRFGRPEETMTRGSGYKLTKRFAVRPHFRRVPCGEGKRDRRLRFIARHFRGPKDAPLAKPAIYELNG